MEAITITPKLATWTLIFYTVAYVAPLYFSKNTRPSLTLNRDSPSVIRGRTIAVSISTISCNIITYVIISNARSVNGVPNDALTLMGYWPLGLIEAGKVLLLNSILFAGPLFETLIIDGNWKSLTRPEGPLSLWNNIHTWRSIIVAPWTEEALFRSAVVPLFVLAGVPSGRTIFLTPVLFGLAHVHHFYEFRVTSPQTPLLMAVIRSAVQFTYTSLFGALATFLFLRSGSFLAVFLLHAQCNIMGFPRVSGTVEPYWLPLGIPSSSTQIRVWTAAYYVILVTGAVMWYKNLWTLSYGPNGLY